MKYYKICKYDYNDSDYEEDWTTPVELIERLKSRHVYDGKLPESYFELENRFLDIIEYFFALFPKGMFEYLYFTYDPKDYDVLIAEGFPGELFDNLLLPLKSTIAKIKDDEFHKLSLLQKRFLFQLSVRCISQVGVKDEYTDACISDMSDGFYWFIALPDEINISDVVKNSKMYAYEWNNIFEEE